MIEILVAVAATVVFIVGFRFLKVVAIAQRIIEHARVGVGAMLNIELSDIEKERATRKAGVQLLLGSFAIFWRMLLCAAAGMVPVYGVDYFGYMTVSSVFDLFLSWEFIVVITAVLLILVSLIKRFGASGEISKPEYSLPDQLLHIVAFSNARFQKALAECEYYFFNKKIDSVQLGAPVFVTSLARGGTTAMLNALSASSGFVTYQYKDMPFITSPLLWGKFSSLLNRKVNRRKRLHGDNLEIDLNSPEAFDEVIWKLLWPKKYSQVIDLWTAEDYNKEKNEFLQRNIRSLACLRHKAFARYLSKNNANIARLNVLPQMFPGCSIIVPIRDPIAHASSLHRQQLNFSKLQGDDEFTKRYMRDIGHFDFGLIHKPIAFNGFEAGIYSPDSPDYWLNYWISAFSEVIKHSDFCVFVSQDDLRDNPNRVMAVLGNQLSIDLEDEDFRQFFVSFPDKADTSAFSQDLVGKAYELYESLVNKKI